MADDEQRREDDAEDLIGVVDADDSWTVSDRLDGLEMLSEADLVLAMRELGKRRPELGLAKVMADERNARDVEYHLERRRREAKERNDAEAEERALRDSPLHVESLGDLASRVASGELSAPVPTIGELLYPGRVNAFFGDYTAGKTWTALHLAQLAAADGGHTLFIDYEDTAVGLAARCLALDPKLAEFVHYIDGSALARLDVRTIRRHVHMLGITYVVVDSTGMSLAAYGADPNSDDEVARWFSTVANPIAHLGPAVVLLDHVPKRSDGRPTPVGSFRKGAAITGAQYLLEAKDGGFSRAKAGSSALTCTKDRNGFYATGQRVGHVMFVPSEDGAVEVTLALAEDDKPTGPSAKLDSAILLYTQEQARLHGSEDADGNPLEARPGITRIRERMKELGFKGRNDVFAEAVGRLVKGGWLTRTTISTGPKSTRDVYVPATPFEDAEPPE